MSKALVIKGASFAANKVRTITISTPVPCTGIVINKNSIAFTAIGATDTLTATLTPADTTEALTWASSDTDVATVSNGLVTSVGIGTATITAYCGEYSASCDVTVSATLSMDDYAKTTGYRYSGSINYSASPVHDGVGITADAACVTYVDANNTLDGYRAFVGSTEVEQYGYPIPIPTGAKTAVFTVPTSIIAGNSRMRIAFLDSQTKQTYISGESGNAAKGIFAQDQNRTDGTGSVSINLSSYPDVDSFILSVKDNDNTTPDNISGVTVAFS